MFFFIRIHARVAQLSISINKGKVHPPKLSEERLIERRSKKADRRDGTSANQSLCGLLDKEVLPGL